MRAILKDGTQMTFSGADVKEISISIFDDIICVTMYDGRVLLATALYTKGAK